MARYLVTVEYRGTEFVGFQKQPGLPTVQGALEGALMDFTAQEVRVYGAGRTDSGVHAVGQAATFDLPVKVDTERSMRSFNGLLPQGVVVTSMRQAPQDFDVRREAISREYRYFIFNRPVPSPLLEEITFHFPGKLNLEGMQKACALVAGEHDFSAFRLKAEGGSSRREVLDCRIEEVNTGLLCLFITANSFLYRMVRIMAGAVLWVGSGRMSLEEFESHLGGGNKPCADPLPAHGLFLWRVTYPPKRLESGSRRDTKR